MTLFFLLNLATLFLQIVIREKIVCLRKNSAKNLYNFLKARILKTKKQMSGYRPGQLIREIKARPGIYDKEHLQHPKREHKHKLWLEVAECLTPDEDWEQYTEQEKEARSK